jgi:hypothetical protein
MKKVWKKPKLVGLYRGGTEEAVLSCCKNSDGPYVDPNHSNTDCKQQEAGFDCDCCDAIVCT